MRYSLRTTTLKAHSCLLYERIENSPNGRKTKSTLKITREKCEWGKEEKKAKGNVSGKKRETNGVEEVVANGGKLSPALPSTLLTLLQPVASTICNHANCHTTELVCHTHVGCFLSLGFSLSTLLIVFFFSCFFSVRGRGGGGSGSPAAATWLFSCADKPGGREGGKEEGGGRGGRDGGTGGRRCRFPLCVPSTELCVPSCSSAPGPCLSVPDMSWSTRSLSDLFNYQRIMFWPSPYCWTLNFYLEEREHEGKWLGIYKEACTRHVNRHMPRYRHWPS